MRPIHPPGRGLRAALVSAVGVAALLAATVGPAAAKPPGPPTLPAGQVVNESLVLSVQMPPGPPIVPGG